MSVERSSLYTCHRWVWKDLPCTPVINECGMIFPVHLMDECGMIFPVHLSWMSVEWSSLYTCQGWVWIRNDLPCTLVMNECGMIFPVHFSWMTVESSSLYFNVVLTPYCRCQWSKILLTFFVKGKCDILKSRSLFVLFFYVGWYNGQEQAPETISNSSVTGKCGW